MSHRAFADFLTKKSTVANLDALLAEFEMKHPEAIVAPEHAFVVIEDSVESFSTWGFKKRPDAEAWIKTMIEARGGGFEQTELDTWTRKSIRYLLFSEPLK